MAVIYCCIFPLLCFAQEGSDTTRKVAYLDEYLLVGQQVKRNESQVLSREQIQRVQANDLGELLTQFSGVALKNYGGLGGMKTISVRGFSGAHSGIVLDRFLIQNTQTGQVDLGQLQVDNVQEIRLNMLGNAEVKQPVSAYLQANVLSIKSFENTFSESRFSLRYHAKIGSFGQKENYLALKFRRNKWLFSASGKYRYAHGNYPFEVQNGNQTYNGIRLNNDLSESMGQIALNYKGKNGSTFQLNSQLQHAKKGLPGAVILYNPSAVQTLINLSLQTNLAYDIFSKTKRLYIRNYLSHRIEDLQYLDSSYLNNLGYLDQRYRTQHVQHGLTANYVFMDSISSIYAGIEQNISKLAANNVFSSDPSRYNLKEVIGYKYLAARYTVNLQMSQETNWNKNGMSSTVDHGWTGAFNIQYTNPDFRFGTPILWLKRTFRVPTFSELYYNQLGNVLLKPEIANQLNVGNRFAWKNERIKQNLNVDIYLNLMENKILAIPTKNLFIWSMQNIGNVAMTGLDLRYSAQVKTQVKDLTWDYNLNYSFMYCVDVSNRESPTYGHQIPYVPRHNISTNLVLRYRTWSVSTDLYFQTKTFALNENVKGNQVPAFSTLDLHLNKKIVLGTAQSLKLQFSIRNLTDQSYAYIRYFAMPGRSYLFGLSYEIH